MARIAMLHTSFVFITTDRSIEKLIGELMPDDELIHFVDSDVLAQVIKDKEITDDSAGRVPASV